MPTYFFDFCAGDIISKDDLGVELDGIGSVRRETVRTLIEIAKDLLSAGRQRTIAMSVTDEDGQPVLNAALLLLIDVKTAPSSALQ